MKKFLFFLSAILLLSQYYCQKNNEEYVESDCWKLDGVSGKKDCNNRVVGSDFYRCCYVKYTAKNEKGKKETVEACQPITKKDYDRIKDYIKEEEKEGEEGDLDIKKVDCNSNYLLISIMSLIPLLFL